MALKRSAPRFSRRARRSHRGRGHGWKLANCGVRSSAPGSNQAMSAARSREPWSGGKTSRHSASPAADACWYCRQCPSRHSRTNARARHCRTRRGRASRSRASSWSTRFRRTRHRPLRSVSPAWNSVVDPMFYLARRATSLTMDMLALSTNNRTVGSWFSARWRVAGAGGVPGHAPAPRGSGRRRATGERVSGRMAYGAFTAASKRRRE